ncbi:MAG: hypothetical protein IJT96_07325 [Lachnospiraceae bacterium]|nr:hypothetical protein [Lachnospiraceae bacterium]
MKNTGDKAIRTAVMAGLTAASAGVLAAIGQPLIIMLGVRAASLITIAVPAVGGILTVCSGADLISAVMKERRLAISENSTQRLDIAADGSYKEDMTSPDATRERLNRISSASPRLSGLMGNCITQLDRMDELQRRQGELLTLNQAAYLKDTVGTLDQVEKEICLNLRGVVNQCIVAGEGADVSRLDMDKVESILSQNQKLLEQSKELLVVSADWIDKYNSQEGGADRSLLDNWIKVIQDTIKGIDRN